MHSLVHIFSQIKHEIYFIFPQSAYAMISIFDKDTINAYLFFFLEIKTIQMKLEAKHFWFVAINHMCSKRDFWSFQNHLRYQLEKMCYIRITTFAW